MLDTPKLKSVLAKQDASRKDKVLSILIFGEQRPKPVSEIQSTAISHGLREITKWNISQILKTSGLAIRLPDGWEITETGIQYLEETGLISTSPVRKYQSNLRDYIDIIQSETTGNFLEECILALEMNLLRSAAILSWAGAISILYDEVISRHLQEFNMELKRRFPKHKMVKTSDDLALLKEFEFLQIISHLSLIDKNTKQELEQCLQLRNSCAHPNSLLIGEAKVASHLEILILNVYQKFLV